MMIMMMALARMMMTVADAEYDDGADSEDDYGADAENDDCADAENDDSAEDDHGADYKDDVFLIFFEFPDFLDFVLKIRNF